MNRYRYLCLISGVCCALLVSSCKSGPPSVTIGLNAELTGSIPVVGQSCRNAAQLAVKEVNQAGGLTVGGKVYHLDLAVEDNEDKAESSAAVAQKFAGEGVVAMIGPNASRDAIPAAEVAEASHLPMISPWSTGAKLTINTRTNQPKKYVFRAAFTDNFQGKVDAKFAINQLKTKRPAVLYDIASEYNKGIAEVYRKTLAEQGVQCVAYESYTTGDKDFSSQLTSIINAGADSLFLPNYYSEVPLQIKQARRLGYKGKILGSDSWGNQQLISLCQGQCEGLFFSSHYAPDIATPRAKKFIAAYKAAYGSTPDDVAALTYDSFQMLFQAIRTANSVDHEAIRKALAGLHDFEGVTGTMEFHGTGDPIKSAVIIEIKHGKFTFYQNAKP